MLRERARAIVAGDTGIGESIFLLQIINIYIYIDFSIEME